MHWSNHGKCSKIKCLCPWCVTTSKITIYLDLVPHKDLRFSSLDNVLPPHEASVARKKCEGPIIIVLLLKHLWKTQDARIIGFFADCSANFRSKVKNNVARNDNSSLISNKNENLVTCSSDEDCDDCNGCTVDAWSKEKKTCNLA